MARRAVSLLLVLVILSTCSGCTLVGLGIGAAIPKKTTYEVSEGQPIGETLRAAAVREDLEVGDDMDVTVQRDMCMQNRTCANLTTGADYAIRPDAGAGINLSGRMYD